MLLYLTISICLKLLGTFVQEPVIKQHFTNAYYCTLNVDTVPSQQGKQKINSNNKSFKDTITWSNIAKAKISLLDSTLWVRGDIRKDYRIIGYEKSTLKSRALILFSVFTQDIKDNPLNFPFGYNYSTDDMTFEDTKFKFVSFQGDFAKVLLISEGKLLSTFYFPRKWVEFSK